MKLLTKANLDKWVEGMVAEQCLCHRAGHAVGTARVSQN